MNNIRYHFIDRAKALSMTLVVFAHIYTFCIYHFDGQATSSLPLFSYTMIFRMPLFMMLSGLVIRPKFMDWHLTWESIWKRSRQVIVPVLIIGTIYSYLIGHNFVDYISHNMKYGYWYIFTLFEFFSLYCLYQFVTVKINKGWIFDAIIAILILGCCFLLKHFMPSKISDLLCLQKFNLLPWFALGVFIRRANLIEKLFGYKHSFIIYGLPLIALIIYCELGYTINTIYNYVFILMASGFVLSLLYKFESLNWNVLDYVGKNTLDIYMFHYFFLFLINKTFLSLDFLRPILDNHYNVFYELVFGLLPSVLIVAATLGISKMIHKVHFIDHHIYYKKPKLN